MGFWTGYFAAKSFSGGSKGGCIIPFETLAISAGIGFSAQSWWAFGGALLGLFLILAIPPLAMVFIGLMSLCWGALGYQLGQSFSEGMGAPVVLGALFFLVSLGSHLSGLKELNEEQ